MEIKEYFAANAWKRMTSSMKFDEPKPCTLAAGRPVPSKSGARASVHFHPQNVTFVQYQLIE